LNICFVLYFECISILKLFPTSSLHIILPKLIQQQVLVAVIDNGDASFVCPWFVLQSLYHFLQLLMISTENSSTDDCLDLYYHCSQMLTIANASHFYLLVLVQQPSRIERKYILKKYNAKGIFAFFSFINDSAR